MTHLKRNSAPVRWPIPRKGSAFVIKSGEKEIPLLVALRDVLKVARTRKEVKAAIHQKNILICGKPAKDEKQKLMLFDNLTLVPVKKSYSLGLSEKGKFVFSEISEKDISKKTSKIVDKKILKGKKIQLNLNDGRNILADCKCKVNDSVILDLEKKKVLKVLELKDGANALVMEGKHIGEKGKINKIQSEMKMAELEIEGKKFNALIKQLMVLE